MVKYFWDQTNNEGKWRTWKNLHHREDSPLKAKTKALLRILEQSKILMLGGHDQLRWGNNNAGTFNLKEEKHLLIELVSNDSDRVWQKIWNHQGWMKIKLFLWLFHHMKILTQDNIQRTGVLGPSRCQLCEAQEETMEHLLNDCILTSQLWDTFVTIFQQTNRDKKVLSI